MKKSRVINLGKIKIGGGSPPVIQTMITTSLSNFDKALAEAQNAFNLGCKVVRTAFKSGDEAENLKKFVENFKGEIIADIHFDYRLALMAIDAGVSGVRFNPGNIGGKERVKEIIEKAKTRSNFAVRIGVNSGSLEKEILKKYNGVTTEGLVESSLFWADYLEKELGFKNFKISAKSSSVPETIAACQLIREKTDAPLHIGITEAGGGKRGIIKSTAGLSILLDKGLADTFRVSLTAPIEEEIKTGFSILKSLGLIENGADIISCPTCGRTHGAVFEYYNQLEKWFDEQVWWMKPALKVAVMGCEVNGPGEAKEADLGIALGKNSALYFEKGEVVKKFDSQDEAFEHLLKRISKIWG
ncbi:MAG: flavodoxin-dependent (E)-4-hydroxy-3-methylbut-2-enyl-diphosphate synthase [bacterium]